MILSASRLVQTALTRAYIALSYESLPKKLAMQFFLQASITVMILAVLVPPFEDPDEFNHANRVDQISAGGFIATRYGGPATSGGKVDVGINLIDAYIGVVRFHPERKVTRAMMLSANAVHWGTRLPTTFANTSVYSPFLYIPAVIGLLAGKLAGLSITRTLIISRAVSGLACVLGSSIAIGLAGDYALFIMIVLSLPMSVFLFACVSQDGPMLASAAGALALIWNLLLAQAQPRRSYLVVLSICLALIGIGRPAYATFCALPLLLASFNLRDRLLAVTAALSVIAGWSILAAHWSLINAEAFRGVNPAAQLRTLFVHPALCLRLAVSVVTGAQGMEGSSFYRETVGILGWQDVILPDLFYVLAGCALAGAVLVTLPRTTPPWPAWVQGFSFIMAMGAVVLIFLLEYLSWTTVGLPIVQGVQGRYFLPVLMFLPCMLPAFRSAFLLRLCRPIRLALLPFPAISSVVTVATVVHRYYL